MSVIQLVTAIDAFTIMLLIFVSWRTGPRWYVGIASKLFGFLTILNFVASPALVVTSIIITFIEIDVRSSFLITYLLYFICVYSVRFIDFWILIVPYLRRQSFALKVDKDYRENYSEAELKGLVPILTESKDTQDKIRLQIVNEILLTTVPYCEQRRKFGDGYRRIGKSIQLGENIFSLAFVSLAKDQILHENFDVVSGCFWSLTPESVEQRKKVLKAIQSK